MKITKRQPVKLWERHHRAVEAGHQPAQWEYQNQPFSSQSGVRWA